MRKRCFSQTCLFAATLVVAAATSYAQQPPAASGRLSLSERVAKLEQQTQGSPAQGNIELVNQINALQSQVQTLQGQLEELKHQLDELKQRNKEQYIDLDSRLVRIEGHAPSAAQSPHAASDNQLQDIPLGSADDASTPASDSTSHSTVTPTSTPSNDPVAEKAAYDQAFAALKDGRYAESARRFQAFIAQYPKGELTSNAYYWLGESYYVTQNYRLSLETFQHLLNQFPNSQKVADALLKVGYCQYEMKDWAAAEASLNQVVQKYPDTTVARLAQGRLRALKLEGRH